LKVWKLINNTFRIITIVWCFIFKELCWDNSFALTVITRLYVGSKWSLECAYSPSITHVTYISLLQSCMHCHLFIIFFTTIFKIHSWTWNSYTLDNNLSNIKRPIKKKKQYWDMLHTLVAEKYWFHASTDEKYLVMDNGRACCDQCILQIKVMFWIFYIFPMKD